MLFPQLPLFFDKSNLVAKKESSLLFYLQIYGKSCYEGNLFFRFYFFFFEFFLLLPSPKYLVNWQISFLNNKDKKEHKTPARPEKIDTEKLLEEDDKLRSIVERFDGEVVGRKKAED